ncbi:hypothetical protein P3X46_008970 [Hevea brasiliensis]|uniref:Uncharacterized protein n=1 Tax=Hevea brasiliensis TaxID=3981 RepID=A0ABQ9MKT4_HEVBR|nr:hypothetical protein P3X46_008970 [Hevea brasiliensis]
MLCVSFVICSVVLNGEKVGPIVPSRDLRECSNAKHILASYERASIQAINFQNLGIFFNTNVPSLVKVNISKLLSVHTPLNHGRFLGLPFLIGENKKQIFSFLKDRLWCKLQGWKSMFLSRARKEFLLKVVAQAILDYCNGLIH